MKNNGAQNKRGWENHCHEVTNEKTTTTRLLQH